MKKLTIKDLKPGQWFVYFGFDSMRPMLVTDVCKGRDQSFQRLVVDPDTGSTYYEDGTAYVSIRKI
jgi:hypothetical protein